MPTVETIDIAQVVASNTDPGNLILDLLGEAAVGSWPRRISPLPVPPAE